MSLKYNMRPVHMLIKGIYRGVNEFLPRAAYCVF